MNRGSNRQSIFLNDDDYKIFLETLKEAAHLFSIKIISFALMPNHYHLLLTTPKANLSRAMRHLNGVYTQRFNRLHKKDGPLFRGRYKAILIQEDEYLTHLIRYIHLNPITAGLTQDLSKYPWTSHKDYLGSQNRGVWLYATQGLSFFSDKPREVFKVYRQFMKEGVDLKTLKFFDKKHQDPILGNQDFLNQVRDHYLPKGKKFESEIPQKRQLAGEKIFGRIIARTAREFNVSRESIFQSRRGQWNYPRLTAMLLTKELSGFSLPAISKLFKTNSYKTIATNCFRCKALIEENAPLNKKYSRLYRAYSQEEI
jgi:REP element-mobilizing transposase RayT